MAELGELPAYRKKRSGGVSPNTRTKNLYRERGYLCDTVERYDHHAQRTHDFLGMFDIIAIRGLESWAQNGTEVAGLQPTSDSNVAARVDKIRRSPLYEAWLKSGARAVVIGWAVRHGKWAPREVELTLITHPPLACDPLAKDSL